MDGVRGNLAKSQAPTKGAKVRFDKKSEGEVILPTAQIGNLSRIRHKFCPRHKLSLVKPVKKSQSQPKLATSAV